jgi:hypothetical protein
MQTFNGEVAGDRFTGTLAADAATLISGSR